MDQPGRLEPGITLLHRGEDRADHRQRSEVGDAEETGPQPVIDVVIVVGDVVGDRSGLRFRARPAGELEVLAAGRIGGDGRRHRTGAGLGAGPRAGQGAVVLGHPFQALPGQVDPVELGIAALQLRQDAKSLLVVVEAGEIGHGGGERVLAGMAEGRVAEVVGEGHRLGKVLIEPEGAGDRAGDLRHLDAVGQPRAIVVAFVEDEDLSLVFQPPEGGAMDDAVAVALELRAGRARRLGEPAATRFRRPAGIGLSRDRVDHRRTVREAAGCGQRPPLGAGRPSA